MGDQPKQRSLSDISHLFLSSVREKQAPGAARPQRRPPQSAPEPPCSVDLTPEEYRHVFETAPPAEGRESRIESAEICMPRVRAVLAHHLKPLQLELARQYARGVADSGTSVGLIYADAREFRVSTFRHAEGTQPLDNEPEFSSFDARSVRDALLELSCDLQVWLLCVGDGKLRQAREVAGECRDWVLLSTADRDGVVAAYRALKGLAELAPEQVALAVVDATSADEAQQVVRRLSGVCAQFLSRHIEPEPQLHDSGRVAECQVFRCQLGIEQQGDAASHWTLLKDLLRRAKSPATAASAASPDAVQASAAEANLSLKLGVPEPSTRQESPSISADPVPHLSSSNVPRAADVPEVIDLPDEKSEATAILSAVMRHSMNELIECPMRPPMSPDTRLAVSRDRRIVLIGLARQGLSELRTIGQAYQWAIENRALISMAMPQFALDALQHPHLRLFVDQADVHAEQLAPIFGVNTVSIHTYRRIRWAGKQGLLVNAA